MKTINNILAATVCFASLVGCQKEIDRFHGAKTGILELDIQNQHPATKAQVEVQDYPVIIMDAQGAQVERYETVAEVPSSIKLQVGNYTVESHSPVVLKKKMDIPYYAGKKDITILENITTPAEVICRMRNSKISVIYTPAFFETFKSWVITLNDGSETALSFSNENAVANVADVIYWLFDAGVNTITLDFTGVTKDGSKISQRTDITKDMNEHAGYDNDNECFGEGDSITFTFSPTESTEGKVNAISIEADIQFADGGSDDLVIDVVDPGFPDEPGDDDPDGPDGPGGGDEPGPEPPAEDVITLTMPEPISFTALTAATTDPSLGDVKIECKDGIKSVMVKVRSSSDDMIEQLTLVAAGYPGVDLVSGCEVVDNQNLVNFLGGLGQNLTVPAVGDKNYTFPVGNFFLFLAILPGTHNFDMTVTDVNNNTKTGTITVTVTEE